MLSEIQACFQATVIIYCRSVKLNSAQAICHSFDRPIRVYLGKDALKLNPSYPSDEYDFILIVIN